MASENETIEDIIAEMRKRKDMLANAAHSSPLCYSVNTLEAQAELLDEFTDRLDAALAREREPKPLTIAEWIDHKETIKDIAANLRRYVLPSVADKLDAIAKRLYSEIDTAICSIDEASNTDIENIRRIMDENLGDYYEAQEGDRDA